MTVQECDEEVRILVTRHVTHDITRKHQRMEPLMATPGVNALLNGENDTEPSLMATPRVNALLIDDTQGRKHS